MGIGKTRASILRAPVFLFIFMTLALSVAAFSGGASANNRRIITVFADGQKQTVLTDEATVEQAIQTSKIKLNEEDLVEPSRETPINSDVFKINIYRARPYVVVDGGKETSVLSAYQSPRLIAENSGIKVYPEDLFEVELIDDIVERQSLGQRIQIIRAVPVTLNIYGKKLEHRTHAKTIAEVVEEMDIKLAENDILAPGGDTKIEAGLEINVLSVGKDVVAVEEPIPFPTEKIYDSNIDAGTTTVKEPGEDGRKLVTYQLVTYNGAEASRKVLQSVTVKEPKKEVVIVGTKSADPGSNIAIGQEMAASRGWTGAEWGCLLELWTKESGWNHLTSNYGGSGAYGIPQALPGNKMSSAGADWATNPRTQITWGMGYISGRYGSPCGAMAASNSQGWY
jgi:uncharacterized protein YabE (DUF348 family)